MVYILAEQLLESTEQYVLERRIPAVFIVKEDECRHLMKKLHISRENDYSINDVYFCKAEAQQDCIFGTLCVPKLLDIVSSRYKIMFFVTDLFILIVDNSDFSIRVLNRIKSRKTHQGETKAKFIYNFIAEFMNRDTAILEQFETDLFSLEDSLSHKASQDNFLNSLMPIRKQLLTLRGYYDQLAELGKILEEDENHFFTKKQVKCFGTLTDRAERLLGKTIHLLDYAQQVKDLYQSKADERQNDNMQFLTVISTIFFPLTLITGWYGMNFKDMPELADGYSYIKVLSLCVLTVCIIIFKKKKIL